MSPFRVNLVAAVALVTLASASAIEAQCTPGGPPPPPLIPRAIVGTVMDSSHEVLEGVDVIIRRPQRIARTNRDGTFRILDLDPGVYELTVRRIGYEMAIQKYIASDSGSIARFCLIPDPRGLPAMITSVPRGGLSGVIGDSTYATVAGAEVRALGANASALTDTAGGFFLPLKPGRYAITVKKKGYGQQLVSVTIPRDSGRKIAVWLGSPPRNALRIAAAINDSLRLRMMSAFYSMSPNRSRFLSSEDLAQSPGDLEQAVQTAVTAKLDPSCEAIIDGGPFALPLAIIDKADIAAVEVYKKPEPRQTVNSIELPGKPSQPKEVASGCKVLVYVWMKP